MYNCYIQHIITLIYLYLTNISSLLDDTVIPVVRVRDYRLNFITEILQQCVHAGPIDTLLTTNTLESKQLEKNLHISAQFTVIRRMLPGYEEEVV